VTAHQMIHRFAAMQPHQTALNTGANGGVGTALLELLRAHEVRALGLVSRKHFDLIKSLGGEPIESRKKSVETAVHEVLPGGVDVAFDGLGGPRTRECIRALRRGGLVVGYGFMAAHGTIDSLQGFVSLFLGARSLGRRGTFYLLRHHRVLPEKQTPLQRGSPEAIRASRSAEDSAANCRESPASGGTRRRASA
jgi:NADPH2:quinone reductase